MTKYKPEIIFFIIGTNDASIVKSDPKNYESVYKEKLLNLTQDFSAEGQAIFFVLAPNMQDGSLDSNLMKLNYVITQFAYEHSFQTIDAGEVLSPKKEYVKTLNGKTIRSDDGVHIAKDGGKLLSDFIYNMVGELIDLSNDSKDPAIQVTKVAGCCVTPKTSATTPSSNTSRTGVTTTSVVSSSSTSATTTIPGDIINPVN